MEEINKRKERQRKLSFRRYAVAALLPIAIAVGSVLYYVNRTPYPLTVVQSGITLKQGESIKLKKTE